MFAIGNTGEVTLPAPLSTRPPLKVAAAPKGKVLLVDDELAILRAYTKVLTREGYEVKTATDGLLAKELIERESFDVILSDVWMPGMDGITLLRTVRQFDADVPVILATGAPTVADAGEAVEFGALLYLVKPFEFKTLIQVVDHALRLHKFAKIKRDALEHAESSSARAVITSGLETRFEEALASLWIAFQPIVHWRNLSIYGYEALVRCNDPRIPNPEELIHTASRVDRLSDLGRAIRAEVAAALRSAPVGPQFFVNLHTRDLGDNALFAPTAPLSRFADRIVLEITERAPLETVRDVHGRVAALRAMGFRIAVDDMGAGYAGLTAFAQIKPEVVKLDMSIIRGIDQDPVKRKLVSAMTTLCHDMGMQVIAEGIETIAERDAVDELGCELMQGFLFARPDRGFPTPVW
jgi:EAL domain-containing protein (putative c-di-GMP-specific phosphodiesterase class I)/CheY-like chemotaxis protein